MSPGSPDNYPPNSHCQWVVRTGPAKALEFQFTILDVPSSGSECAEDYLILRNGGRSTSPLFLINPGQNEAQNGHLCGSTLPAKKSTSSNHLMVTFRFPCKSSSHCPAPISLSRSDNTTEGRGFSLQYRELTNGCGGSLQLDPHNNQQIIMSPNYPNSPPQVCTNF